MAPSQLDICMKNINLYLLVTLNKNLRWIIALNVKGQTIKLLKENIGEHIFMTLGRQRVSLDKARKGLTKTGKKKTKTKPTQQIRHY